MRIIPAIDIINGKCVRLTKGDYATQKIYSESPLEVAKRFEDFGIKYLHVVDLDGARSNKIINHTILHSIASKTNLKIDFGGGLRSTADVEIAFENGADQITAGSIAVKNEALVLEWIAKYRTQKIILGADCLDKKIATNSWLENTELKVIDFIKKYTERDVQTVICTDIARDGMLEGPSFDLYREILNETKVNLIASGGISSLKDLIALKALGCEGAIIGKAIYEGKINLEDLHKLC